MAGCGAWCSEHPRKPKKDEREAGRPGRAARLRPRIPSGLLRDLSAGRNQPKLSEVCLPHPRATTAPYPNEINTPLKPDYSPRHAMIQVLSKAAMLQNQMSSARQGRRRFPTPHPPQPTRTGVNSQPSRFHSLVQVFKTLGCVEGQGQTMGEACCLGARALELNTTSKSLDCSCGVTGPH